MLFDVYFENNRNHGNTSRDQDAVVFLSIKRFGTYSNQSTFQRRGYWGSDYFDSHRTDHQGRKSHENMRSKLYTY
jgi:hypothetical protein